MKIEQRDSSLEKKILIGMITDSVILGKVASKWEKGLMRNPWANLVGGWCVKYFQKYGKAPKKSIESLYATWASNSNDKSTILLVDKFLSTISDEYANLAKESNSEYIIDLAAEHFNQVKVYRLKENLEGLIDNGEIDKAYKLIDGFGRVEIGVGAPVDVLKDRVAHKKSFASRGKPLITYPGALGTFLNRYMERDGFIAFTGPEKRGKCVSGDMEILLSNGEVKTIETIFREGKNVSVVSYNEKTMRMESSKVSDIYNNGKKECWEVETKTGRKVSTTRNHQYLTPNGWKYLDQISVGGYIAVPKKLDYFGDEEMDENELKFLAYMLAEGGCTSSQSTFTKMDKVLLKDFKDVCDNLKFPFRMGGTGGISLLIRKSNPLRRKLGLWEVSSKTKVIPACVFSCPKEQVRLFLKIFFSCDGYILQEKHGNSIGLTLANERMLRQIGHLLTRFGIVYKFDYNPTTRKEDGKVFPAWSINIRDAYNVSLFLKKINFLSYKRTIPLKIKTMKSFLDKYPPQIALRYASELEVEMEKTHKKVCDPRHITDIKYQSAKGCPSMKQVFQKFKGTETYDKYQGSDILWDEVVSIKSVGLKNTYDLTVPGNENFAANDCIVHNTFFLLDLAWRAMMQRKKVAFFEVGDMSQNQIMMRFSVRAARRPMDPCVVKYPTQIERETHSPIASLEYMEREFKNPLTEKEAWKAKEIISAKINASGEPLLNLDCYPNDSISILGVRSTLQQWERQGWVPDVIVIDYADVLSPPVGVSDSRDQINKTWKQMRSLSQSLHCLLVTATQSDADSYDALTIRKKNFSEDKRKHSHVTGMIGINATEEELELGLRRLNWIDLREGKYSEGQCVHVAGCLELANPCILSTF